MTIYLFLFGHNMGFVRKHPSYIIITENEITSTYNNYRVRDLKENTVKALWLWHFWFSLDHKQQSHDCWKKIVRFRFFQLWFDFLYSLFSWGHRRSYDSSYNSDFNCCGNQPLNISMLCTAVFRHGKPFFEEGGQGAISSQVHESLLILATCLGDLWRL